MCTEEYIKKFCNQHNYDLTVSRNGRWIDQKCTPDVIWSVADFVQNYVDTVNSTFTVNDIWQSDYAGETIAETYCKPGTNEESARNEYDKVFSQPLCMFCYAGILKDISTTNRHLYVVENRKVLDYIAGNDMNACRFLWYYIEKVLSDSGLYPLFKSFFDNQDKERFEALKDGFIKFYHRYTPIQRDYEPKRIFTKVLNPLAFKYHKLGTERGRLSPNPITKADIMYNRDNFRDVYRDKPKGVSRQDWLKQHPEINRREGYFKQMLVRSRKLLQTFNNEVRGGISELTQFMPDKYTDTNPATQMHHIFPKNENPDIMHLIENLIALTPNQHYGYAHPLNNTQRVDLNVQKDLLIAKTSSIEKNLASKTEEHIYLFANLLEVLHIGWDNADVLEIAENDFMDVLHAIVCHYDSY